VRGGLHDLSISRTTFSWGIPVPDAPGHVMYVWLDALTNYITACGFPDEDARAGGSGRRTCISSARTSPGSTPSIGRPS
jgi:methionyl-tRNA synthetase